MDVEALRKQYIPNKVKVLFIAEAKPDADDRFFYYDKVNTRDYLYLHLMYALYGKTKDDVQYLREHKAEFLNTFRQDGYYLVDAVDEIKSDIKHSSKRVKIIKANAENKVLEIRDLLSKFGDQNTKIVLIKTTVFDALYDLLKDDFSVLNDQPIPFPSYNEKNKTNFLIQMGKVTQKLRI